MPHSQAFVWMDSREATVFRFGPEDLEEGRLQADTPFLKVSHRAGALGASRPAADYDFFDRVIDALRGIHLWSLAGPDQAKDALIGYLDKYKHLDGHIAKLRLRLAAISSMDHPTDGVLLDHVRRTSTASVTPASPPPGP